MLKLVKVLFTVLIFAVIFATFHSKLATIEFNKLDWRFLFIAIILPTILNTIIVNNRTRVFLNILGVHENFGDLVKITFTSFFYGFLLPSSNGMDAVRIFQIEKRHPELKGLPGAAVLMERLTGIVLLLCISILSLVFVPNELLAIVYKPIFIVISIMCVLIFVIFNEKLFKRIMSIFNRIKYFKSIVSYANKMIEGVSKIKKNKQVLKSIPLILALQISNIFLVYLLFRCFGINISFFTHLLFMPIIQMLTLIPLTLNGFGIREGAFAFFYSKVAVDPKYSILVSVFYFIILMGIPSLIGGLLTLIGKKSINNKQTSI